VDANLVSGVNDLAMQVRDIESIGIVDGDFSNPCTDEIQQGRGATPTSSDEGNVGTAKISLRIFSEPSQRELQTITGYFLGRKFCHSNPTHWVPPCESSCSFQIGTSALTASASSAAAAKASRRCAAAAMTIKAKSPISKGPVRCAHHRRTCGCCALIRAATASISCCAVGCEE